MKSQTDIKKEADQTNMIVIFTTFPLKLPYLTRLDRVQQIFNIKT